MEYKYIQCVLKKDSNIIMNVESLENIKYLNKERWDIVEILTEEQTLLNVRDNARVWDNARVCGNAIVRDNARVCGNAIVRDNALVGGDAIATTDVFNLTFLNYNVTLTDNHIEIGCKQWTYEEALRLNEIHIGLEYSKDEYDGMKNAKQVLIEMIKLKRLCRF